MYTCLIRRDPEMLLALVQRSACSIARDLGPRTCAFVYLASSHRGSYHRNAIYICRTLKLMLVGQQYMVFSL